MFRQSSRKKLGRAEVLAVALSASGALWVGLDPLIRSSNPHLGWLHLLLTLGTIVPLLLRHRWAMAAGGALGFLCYGGMVLLFAISLSLGEIGSGFQAASYWAAMGALGMTSLGHLISFVQGVRVSRVPRERITERTSEEPWASVRELEQSAEQEAPTVTQLDRT